LGKVDMRKKRRERERRETKKVSCLEGTTREGRLQRCPGMLAQRAEGSGGKTEELALHVRSLVKRTEENARC